MNISKSITKCLEKSGRDSEWLREKLGVSKQRISIILNSNRLSLSKTEEIAGLFDMQVSEFIAIGEENAKHNKA